MTEAQEQAKDWQVRKERGCPAASNQTAFARLRAFPAEVAHRGAVEPIWVDKLSPLAPVDKLSPLAPVAGVQQQQQRRRLGRR